MALLRERSCSSQSQHGLLVSGHSRRPTPSSRTSTSRLPLASLPTPDLAGRSPLPPPPALRVIGLCAATSAVLPTYLRPQVPWLSLTVCPQYSSFVSWRSSNEQNQKLLLSHFARCHCDSRFHADWRRRSLVGISVINSYDFFLPGCQAGSDKSWGNSDGGCNGLTFTSNSRMFICTFPHGYSGLLFIMEVFECF